MTITENEQSVSLNIEIDKGSNDMFSHREDLENNNPF
jgi:hypothetical protein